MHLTARERARAVILIQVRSEARNAMTQAVVERLCKATSTRVWVTVRDALVQEARNRVNEEVNKRILKITDAKDKKLRDSIVADVTRSILSLTGTPN